MSMLMQAEVEQISINALPYKGGYAIEIADSANRFGIPKAAHVDGEFITVEYGQIVRVGNGFSFTVGDLPGDPLASFFYMNDQLRVIRNESGRPLWTHPTLR